MSASIASAQLAYTHAEKIKNNDIKLQGQTSFNDWKEAIEEHAKSVKVGTGNNAITVYADTLAPGFALLTAHNANPAIALQPPPAPHHAGASEYLLALMRLTSNKDNQAKIRTATTPWEAFRRLQTLYASTLSSNVERFRAVT